MNESTTETFNNDTVRLSEMPDYRTAEFEPVAATFRRYTVLSTLATWAPFLLIPFALRLLSDLSGQAALLVAGGLLGLIGLIMVYRWIDAGYRGWALREHDLIARHGILWRSVITLPIARIQHVETTSGPLERSQHLSRLKLFTAGGMTADLTVIGIEAGTADRLREHLVEQIRLRDAADARAETEPQPPEPTRADDGPE
jgi:hypothetical protein